MDLTIMKPGCFVDMHGTRTCFSPADLARTAAVYDAAQHPAPLVIGHPADNAPAFGWVRDLLSGPTGVLVASFERVSEAFKDAVKAGHYRNLSASFYPPQHPSNPRPGVWYLRHVGALGATPPAVRGLSELAFAEWCEIAPAAHCACHAADFAAPVSDSLSRYERAQALVAATGRDMPTVLYYLASLSATKRS